MSVGEHHNNVLADIKGRIHPKMKILSLLTLKLFQTCMKFFLV